MKFVKFFLITVILGISYSCDKKEDQEKEDPPQVSGYAFITSEEGSDLQMEYPDGTTESIGTDFFVGWNTGQLLNGNYFRQLRIGTEEGTLDFRLSIPKDTSFNDVADGEHSLSPRLLLQDTQHLDEVVAELWIAGSDYEDNATGTVTIERSINYEEEIYEVVGEINATFYDSGAQPHIITGHFWSNDAD